MNNDVNGIKLKSKNMKTLLNYKLLKNKSDLPVFVTPFLTKQFPLQVSGRGGRMMNEFVMGNNKL